MLSLLRALTEFATLGVTKNKNKPSLPIREGLLQLTRQFFHSSPCLGCIVKQTHYIGLNTLLCGEDKAIEQETPAASNNKYTKDVRC